MIDNFFSLFYELVLHQILSALNFFIIREISFSLMVKEFKNFGNVLAFLTGVKWIAK